MHIVCETLWLPKKGNTSDEYEDAAAPLKITDSRLETFRCAVADGATETSFSALWARLLVEGYVDGSDLAHLKQLWQAAVSTKQLAWYAEQKAQSGAYAALVGLTLTPSHDSDGGGKWKAEAIGDSCLILVRNQEFVQSFPLNQSDEFNNSPVLLSSHLDDNDKPDQMLATISGAWQPGDVFYLLSDAIARWMYKRQEDYKDAAIWLSGLRNKEDFDQFVDVQRSLTDADSRALMRNDDVTLMRVVPTN
jgi:hypothetical protein